jgi:hypothetical protein
MGLKQLLAFVMIIVLLVGIVPISQFALADDSNKKSKDSSGAKDDKGDKGGKGDKNPSGVTGPAGSGSSGTSLHVIERFATIDSPAGSLVAVGQAFCNPGELATGGGFFVPGGVTVFSSHAIDISNHGWVVSFENPLASPVTFQVVVECANVGP